MKAAKYLKSGDDAVFGKIPHLLRADGTMTADHKEQAEELLTKFFPPLPDRIDDEGTRPQRTPVEMSAIPMEEVERQLLATKSWKAPGEDGLPAIVWKMTWLVVKHGVLELFRMSLEEGALPRQWRHAKIIPFKKPNKENYTIAKAWRPISLLATLGKVLESVIAERISHAVETYGLLPTSHFGARKQRSAEQALLLLQEHIYAAWRGRRVLSLVSFDVKGAYNGVCKERLLQRMQARGIPEVLLQRIGATFEAEKTTIIHFAPKAHKSDSGPFTIKGETVELRDHIKILSVVMDTRLIQGTHRESSVQGPGCSDGASTTSRSNPSSKHGSYSPRPWRRWWTMPPIQQNAQGGSASDRGDIPHSCDQRSGSGGPHRHGPTPALETSCEDVDGHAHPTSHQSPPQVHSSDQEIQKIPPFASVSGRRRAEKHLDGNTGKTINPFTLAP
ncbi:hypothetical protein N7523_010259 [Penicillium sp. IBT 18751x]|nr:hypothetical protein N7523_010259 [Penicillium sp. IBT 18751x]